jgi:hypothetical protein
MLLIFQSARVLANHSHKVELLSHWLPRKNCSFGAYSIPKRSAILARSNPTTTASSIRITGVVIKPRSCNSCKAASSLLTSRSSNSIPFCERNSFVRLQNIQPGWLKRTTRWLMGASFVHVSTHSRARATVGAGRPRQSLSRVDSAARLSGGAGGFEIEAPSPARHPSREGAGRPR